MPRSARILALILAQAALLGNLRAQTLPKPDAWNGKDLAGNPAQVPAPGKVSVLVFVQPGQEQTRRQLADITKELPLAAGDLQLVAITSGPSALQHAREVEPAQWPFPVLVDEDYSASGKFEVHAWPTTVILDAHGTQVGRLPGWSVSFATSLPAYLAFAQGKSTRDELERALAAQGVVQDSSDQKASRHLMLAERLYQSDRRDDAAEQLKAAQDLAPATPALRLRLARAELLLGQVQKADDLLKTLEPAGLPAGELSLLRGWAAMAGERWPDAKALLLEALHQGADAAQTHYRLGLVFTHEGDQPHAAEAFRNACQSTPLGSRLAPATQP